MIIATLETKPILGDRKDHGPVEVGTFSLSVHLDEKLIAQAVDTRSFILKHVAMYLASAVKDTGVSPNMWVIFFPEKICREIGVEPRMDMEFANAIPGFTV